MSTRIILRPYLLSHIVVGLISVFLASTSLLHAQSVVTKEPESGGAESVAIVNIQNTRLVEDNGAFIIRFTLANRIGIQPGIKYGVVLVKDTPLGQVVVDQRTYTETITLGPGEHVIRDIVYRPQPQTGSTYSLLLVAESQYGFPFGMNYLGEVTFKDTTTTLFADPSTCYLTVGDDTGASSTHYAPMEGVDVAPSEALYAHCVVENRSENSIQTLPTVTTHERTLFGTTSGMRELKGETLSIRSGEKREVSVELPKPTAAQAYSVRLLYGEGGNEVLFRYVVQGGSGTLQNVVFDKNFYTKGETAQVSILWSPSADGYIGARNGMGTVLTEPSLLVSLTDGEGNACGAPYEYRTAGNYLMKMLIPVTNDCAKPQVHVRIADEMYGELSNSTYSLLSSESLAPEPLIVDESPSFSLRHYVGIGIGILVMCGLIVWVCVRRKHAPTIAVPPIVILLLICGGIFAGPLMAHADSFWAYNRDTEVNRRTGSNSGTYRAILYTVNLDRSVYKQGDDINITGSGVIQGECGNRMCGSGVDCRATGLWVTAIDSVPISPVYIIDRKEGTSAGNTPGQAFFGAAVIPVTMSPGVHTMTVRGIAATAGEEEMEYTVNLGFVVSPPLSGGGGGGGGGAATIPTLSTPIHSFVSANDAYLGAVIEDDGGSPILERGTCWGLTTDPTVNCASEGGTEVSPFSHLRAGLTVGSTIYYRGYARNAAGTGYSPSNAFDTVTPIDIVVCTLGGTACVPGGGTKEIDPGGQIEVVWNNPGATSCTKVRGPGDLDIPGTGGTDQTVTEPVPGTSAIITISCTTGPQTSETSVIVTTKPYPNCPNDTKSNCVLPSSAHNVSAGSCQSGYSGNCQYRCDSSVLPSSWDFVSNTCAVSAITRFEICDAGMDDASCVTAKNVPPRHPLHSVGHR